MNYTTHAYNYKLNYKSFKHIILEWREIALYARYYKFKQKGVQRVTLGWGRMEAGAVLWKSIDHTLLPK